MILLICFYLITKKFLTRVCACLGVSFFMTVFFMFSKECGGLGTPHPMGVLGLPSLGSRRGLQHGVGEKTRGNTLGLSPLLFLSPLSTHQAHVAQIHIHIHMRNIHLYSHVDCCSASIRLCFSFVTESCSSRIFAQGQQTRPFLSFCRSWVARTQLNHWTKKRETVPDCCRPRCGADPCSGYKQFTMFVGWHATSSSDFIRPTLT